MNSTVGSCSSVTDINTHCDGVIEKLWIYPVRLCVSDILKMKFYICKECFEYFES